MNRSPMPRRRATPRRLPKVLCSFQRCKSAPRAEGLCRTHLTREADRLFSLMIRARDGRCIARDYFPEVTCRGTLQAMHLVSRSWHAVRYDPENAAAGCAGHHYYLTFKTDEHYDFCERLLGTKRYGALRARRREEPRPLGEVLVELREQAAA